MLFAMYLIVQSAYDIPVVFDRALDEYMTIKSSCFHHSHFMGDLSNWI